MLPIKLNVQFGPYYLYKKIKLLFFKDPLLLVKKLLNKQDE